MKINFNYVLLLFLEAGTSVASFAGRTAGAVERTPGAVADDTVSGLGNESADPVESVTSVSFWETVLDDLRNNI